MLRVLSLLLIVFCLARVGQSQQAPTPGAQVEQTLADEAGDLGYLLYLPKTYDEQPDKRGHSSCFYTGEAKASVHWASLPNGDLPSLHSAVMTFRTFSFHRNALAMVPGATTRDKLNWIVCSITSPKSFASIHRKSI